MRVIPSLLCDFYKTNHKDQYPEGTEKIYSTWTPRMSRLDGINKVVAYGYQGFIKEWLIEYFNKEFFGVDVDVICGEYERYIKFTLGVQAPDSSHIRGLHKLGYLPVKIYAVPEGTRVPVRVPMLTIESTHEDFSWITNYLESFMSAQLWSMSTSATIADEYNRILTAWANETVGNTGHIPFQGHDFSFRGMPGVAASYLSGSAHLLSFAGTDSIPAIMYHEAYYNANIETELVGTSIPATEHSVQCLYNDEEKYFNDMHQRVYPEGFISIVSDGYDYWKMLSETITQSKDKIMARNGKVVIRPDSGDPVKIICGDITSESEIVRLGTIEYLWDVFGGTVNELGYKELDSHIGAIYGDSITIDRADEICRQLAAKGFASSNIVFGIGSFTYQFNTRDTFGFALKATYGVVNGEERLIFKDPKTDDGTKKSQKGMVITKYNDSGEIIGVDELTMNQRDAAKDNIMRPIFENGELLIDDSLVEIRKRLEVR